MLNDTSAIIRSAWEKGLAVPAFNIPYLPMMAPVIRAARDQDAFALVAVARLEWHKFGAVSPGKVYEEFQRHSAPGWARLHLDHMPVVDEDGERVDYMDELASALDLGYQSVMIDGSRLSFRENIECTAKAVKLARARGVPCEAELGAVTGHEEAPLMSYEELFNSKKGFTRIDEARIFVERTGCDWLSVAAGNVHGAIAESRKDREKEPSRLDLEHLSKLAAAANVPLVLHGGSGMVRGCLLEAVKAGVAKVNIATEIRQPYERVLSRKGPVEDACDAVYERASWILGEYLESAGKREKILGYAK